MGIDWKGQIAALKRDGYDGAISLETHWRGPDGNTLEASSICGRNLRELVRA
jgi:sugar phosphate isomerase/epimerase